MTTWGDLLQNKNHSGKWVMISNPGRQEGKYHAMRIQRIIDACELMATKDQAGTLEKLTQLHVEVEKDPAGWLCDWWQMGTPGRPVVVGHWKLGRMLIRIAGDKLKHLETDLRVMKRELQDSLEQFDRVRERAEQGGAND